MERLDQGKHPGDWCTDCKTVRSWLKRGDFKKYGWEQHRREPCMTIMDIFSKTGQTDKRCMASQQAKYNQENGIQGSL